MGTPEERLLRMFYDLRAALIEEKPGERSELARGYAVTITEFEKVIGYFKTFVVPIGTGIKEKEANEQCRGVE